MMVKMVKKVKCEYWFVLPWCPYSGNHICSVLGPCEFEEIDIETESETETEVIEEEKNE